MLKQAVSVLQNLIRTDPKNIEWNRMEAVTFVKIAETRIAMGDVATALQYHADALKTLRNVSAIDGENIQARADVAFQLFALGDALLRNNKRTKAIDAIREAHDILHEVTNLAPSNVQWRAKLEEIKGVEMKLGLTKQIRSGAALR